MPVASAELDRLDRLRVGTPAAVSQGDLSVSGNATISGTSTLTGNVTLSGTLTVAGAVTAQAALSVAGAFSSATGLLLTGNPTPTALMVGLTNDVDTRAPATGRGTIAFPSAGSAVNLSNEAWLKVYSGTTAYWLPAFSALYSR